MACRGYSVFASLRGMPTVPHSFGDVVHRLRKKIEPSQEELAPRAGLSWTHMSEMSAASRTYQLTRFDRVAKALDLTLA